MKLRNSKIENLRGFTRWLSCKEFTCKTGDTGDTVSIPGLERSLGEGNGDPIQYSCLENPLDSGVWRATVHRVMKSQTELND